MVVLFSSAGRRVALIDAFRADARELGLDLRVLAVDLDPGFSPACQRADASFRVPPCSDPAFIPTLRDLCQREGVDLVIPTIDTELLFLAGARASFQEFGTRLVVSDLPVVELARDKERTANALQAHGIPAPRSAAPAEILAQPSRWRWPLILKPRGGSSSVGLQICRTPSEFELLARTRDDYVAQEYGTGREFTINLFFSHQGELRCIVPHLRRETRAGEVSKAITARHPLLMQIGGKMGAALAGARGPLCFQAIAREDGSAAVFEINARFGGGYPVAHRAGAKFSKWLLEEAAGCSSTANNDWQEGVVMLRYDAAIFTTTTQPPR